MKTKKTGFIAVLAVTLFITAMLVTTCIDPMADKEKLEAMRSGSDPVYVPPGKVAISVSINDTNVGRTVFPTEVAAANWYYKMVLTNTSGGADDGDDQEFSGEGPFNLIIIENDAYTVVVLGYTSEAARTDDEPSISGSFTIASATNLATATAIMTAIVDGTDDGRLSYTITAAPTDATGTVAIAGIGNTTDLTAQPLSNTNLPLGSGYYRVVATISLDEHRTITVPEVVHIYPNMTSTYNRTLTVNRYIYDISYLNDDGSDFASTIEFTNNKITHGNTITAAPTVSGDVTTLDNLGVTTQNTAHLGWSTTIGGSQVTFPSPAIYRQGTVYYAVYAPAGAYQVITIQYVPDAHNMGITIDPTSLTLAEIQGSTPINIIFPNYANYTTPAINFPDGSTVTITGVNTPITYPDIQLLGDTYLTVTATLTATSTPYSHRITFTADD